LRVTKAQENPNVDAQKIIKYLQDDLGLARLRDKVGLMLFVLGFQQLSLKE